MAKAKQKSIRKLLSSPLPEDYDLAFKLMETKNNDALRNLSKNLPDTPDNKMVKKDISAFILRRQKKGH